MDMARTTLTSSSSAGSSPNSIGSSPSQNRSSFTVNTARSHSGP